MKLGCFKEPFVLFACSKTPVDKDKVLSGDLSRHLKQSLLF